MTAVLKVKQIFKKNQAKNKTHKFWNEKIKVFLKKINF
jgi:hypothetical protein